MAGITTEHRGYPIRYSENEDVWNCYDLGGHSSGTATAPTLSALKAKIDAILLAERKENKTPCLILSKSQSGESMATEAHVIEYISPKYDWSSFASKRYVVDHLVATLALRKGRERVSRQEQPLSSLAPDTPEVRHAIQVAKDRGRAVIEAQQAFEEAYKAIPRLQLTHIENLVRISGVDPTGGVSKE